MRHPLRSGLLAVLGGLLAWLVGASWAPFVEGPGTYLREAAVVVAVVAVLGTLLRWRRAPAAVVLVLQVVVALAWLQWRFWDLGPLWRPVRAGALALNTQEAPVPVEYVGTAAFLATCTVLLAIGVDLLAVSLSRAAVVGLPLLLALTIPISTLDARLPLALLLAAIAVFVVLLALEHRWAADDWGRVIGAVRTPALLALVTGLAAVSAALGLVAAAVLPTSQGLELDRGGDDGRGEINVSNPMVEIRRGLVNQSHLRMLTVKTPQRTPRYVRLAVLDEFDTDRWTPSPRELPRENRVADGVPEAPGLNRSVPGNVVPYELSYSEAFSSRWLATPYPYRSVEVSGGDYRYDVRTLDLFDTAGDDDDGARAGYEVEAFVPSFDAADLDSAGSAPADVDEEMTRLPERMPQQVADIAADVVGEERTDYQRVVALQDWFRSSGGFRYSLWEGPPTSGTDALVGFLTTDKVGYCEQFATAMAVLARTVGVPSRVAVGFGRPQSSSGDGSYVFTGESLHAWTEVYFEGYGWVVFDPTPAVQSGPAPAYSEGVEEAPRAQPGETATPSAQPAPTRPDAGPDATRSGEEDQGVPVWPLLALGLVLVAGVAPRVVRAMQRRRRLRVLADPASSPVDLADALWRELRATAVDHRLDWPAERSPRATLATLQRQLALDPEQQVQVAAVAGTVERARYARSVEVDPVQRENLHQTTRVLLTTMARQSSPGVRRRARWWPRSLWQLRR